MRKVTIITGVQGSGKSMLARQILKGEHKAVLEVDGINAFKDNLKDYNSMVNYIIDEVSLTELKRFLTGLFDAKYRDFNIIITLQEDLTEAVIAESRRLKDVTIIRAVKY